MAFNKTEYNRVYHRARNVDRKVWLDSLKDVPCIDCGGRFPPECMDFDHVRGEKSFNVGHGADRSQIQLAAEIAKCEVVCANCHRIRTAGRRKQVMN